LYAEETAQLIDTEIKRLLSDARTTARRVLTDRREQLETVTRRLLQIEVMEGDELRQILGIPHDASKAVSAPTPAPIPAGE